MADNFTLPATGTTGASDEISGVHYQRVKVSQGADGTAVDVSPAAPLHVTQVAGTAALANVSGSASSVTILAANTARRAGYVYNDSTAVLYLAFAATASTTAYTVRVEPYQLYELPVPVYTGQITGIWSAAAGAARVTEVTA